LVSPPPLSHQDEKETDKFDFSYDMYARIACYIPPDPVRDALQNGLFRFAIASVVPEI